MFELDFFQDPFNVDLVINLTNDGIKLIFDQKFPYYDFTEILICYENYIEHV